VLQACSIINSIEYDALIRLWEKLKKSFRFEVFVFPYKDEKSIKSCINIRPLLFVPIVMFSCDVPVHDRSGEHDWNHFATLGQCDCRKINVIQC
jgi:hypothetical protein